MTKKLTAQDLVHFRSILTRLKAEIAGDIGDLETDAFSLNGDRVSVDNPADIGSDSFAQEFSLELLARDEATLGEIHDALDRLEHGSFGRCEACEAWIPRARLNAVPFARNCVDCQRRAERA